MRYIWAVVVAVFITGGAITAGTAYGGDITYNIEGTPVTRTVNANQTTRMVRLKDHNNAVTGQSQTTNQWARDTVDACFKGQDQQLSAVEAPTACATFATKTPAEQATALTTYFGNVSPCP